MDKEIITFKDFLSIDKENDKKHVFESIESIEDNDENFFLSEERIKYLLDEFELSNEDISNLTKIEEESNSDEFYNLYRDLNENFTCDVFIEGASPEKSSARLIIESSEWNIIFNGKIEDGKCVIPIKKLDILKENLIGNIKLEIIAEGNVFTPWENKFLVKSSKNVSTLNEKMEKKIGVRVDKIK